MANAWLSHVKKTMKHMKSKGSYKKGDGLKKVIMEAKKTYKKGGATGNVAVPASPVNAAAGGRRRTRRHSRK